MDDRIRFLRNPRPIRLTHTQLFSLKVTDNDLQPSALDPLLIPRRTPFSALPQPRDGLLRVLRTNVADDLLDLLPASRLVEQVTEDESAEEARRARKEDGLRTVRDGRLLVRLPEDLDERVGVLRVLVVLLGFLLVARRGESKVGISETVEFTTESADGRVVEDEPEGSVRSKRLAELEDEAGGEDRVTAEVEEGVVEGNLGRGGGEEGEPDVVDSLLGGSEGLRRRGGRTGGGGSGGDGVGEGEGGLVDFAVRVERHASERDDDCGSTTISQRERREDEEGKYAPLGTE